MSVWSASTGFNNSIRVNKPSEVDKFGRFKYYKVKQKYNPIVALL